jgi:molecular chaperone DnaK (HSP70)
MTDWVLAIDFGTSFTTAAIRDNGAPELVPLTTTELHNRVMPSAVFLPWKTEPVLGAAADGSVAPPPGEERPEQRLVVGWTAEHQALIAPDRFEPTPKRRLGTEKHLVLGGEPLGVAGAVGRVLRYALEEARRTRGGRDPTTVALTHPASWAEVRVEALIEAACAAGIEAPRLLSEPEAAALHLGDRVPVGARVAVYDLGGGTFDAAVLERTGETTFRSVARPGGQDGLGGEEFDRKLYDYIACELAAEDPDNWEHIRDQPRAHRDFRIEVRRAKQALSLDPTYDLYLPGEGGRTSYRITVAEFHGLIRRDIDTSVEILRQTLMEAGIDDPADTTELAAIYLAGGSSRIPLVAQVIGERLNRVPETSPQPKEAVALGATVIEHARRPAARAGETTDVASGPSPDATSPREDASRAPAVGGWKEAHRDKDKEEDPTLVAELEKWNWGACLLGPIWGFGHGIFRSLLTLIPIYGIREMVLLGRNGNEWAWERRRWASVESFRRTQRTWALWAFAVWIVLLSVVILLLLIRVGTLPP